MGTLATLTISVLMIGSVPLIISIVAEKQWLRNFILGAMAIWFLNFAMLTAISHINPEAALRNEPACPIEIVCSRAGMFHIRTYFEITRTSDRDAR